LEIKTKANEVVNEMKRGTKSYDYQHKGQIMAYMYFARIGHKLLGFDKLGLEKCIDGTIIYISRDDPSNIAEFIIQYDNAATKEALERLASYRQAYLDDKLPTRPKTFWWTSEPCKWCEFKKGCKIDHTEKITTLSESNLIKNANLQDDTYDLNKIRQSIDAYWASKD
jgi:CRISPR/Cas system-associated exonuclease Cas4 (RecB family)